MLIGSGGLSDFLVYGAMVERYSSLFSAIIQVETLPAKGRLKIIQKMLAAPLGHQIINVFTTIVYKKLGWLRKDPLESLALESGIKFKKTKHIDPELFKTLQELRPRYIFHGSANIVEKALIESAITGVITVSYTHLTLPTKRIV